MHVIAVAVEGGEQDAINDLVGEFGSTVRVCSKGLLRFCQEQVVLRFHRVSLDLEEESLRIVAVRAKL